MILIDKIYKLAYLYGIEKQTSLDSTIEILQTKGALPQDFNINNKDDIFINIKQIDDITKNIISSEDPEVVQNLNKIHQYIDSKILRMAHLYGVENETTIEKKVNALKAMDIIPEHFDQTDSFNFLSNAKLVTEIVNKRENAEYEEVVHQVSVLRKNRVNEIIISLPENIKNLSWRLNEEGGNGYDGKTKVEELEKVYDDTGNLCCREINGVKYIKYKFSFPFDVNLGYHTVTFSYDEPGQTEAIYHTSRLISAPEKCYDGIGITEGKKTWGVPVQIYEQVSDHNLGIGNFSDLAQIGNTLGRNGAGIIGVNPMHAMRDDYPENASPYSPDSRMFYNYIYLDVTAVKEFQTNPDIQDYYHSDELQSKIKQNRRRGYVDYAITQELVDDILYKCYDKFLENKKTEDYKRFCVFCDDAGEDLEMYATFRALCKVMSKKDPAPINWEQWPEEYRKPNNPEVQEFRKNNRYLINYYKYNQWQCEHQLEKVQDICLSSGMKIGLYTDMAVGCSCRGFEAWNYSDLYLKAAAGAPADILSQNGQNWQLLGFSPLKLREYGYEPYRKIIHASMKFSGCIRIDHVLQLQRLYMIPYDKKPEDGAFIYYNTDELMAIVALESHRNKTMVIGEDLGILTDGFRPKLEDFGILSYRVLPFERDWAYKSGHGTNAMKHPNEYPQISVCATSTHDTPPLACQWNVQDIYQKHKLGMISTEQANDKFEQYATQREALNYALEEKGCWNRVGGKPCMYPRQDASKIPEKYTHAVMDYLGQSNSAIMLIPFSDIFETKEMGNIPGITELSMSKKETLVDTNMDKAYPNWRKKMHIPVDFIDKVPIFNEVVKIVNQYRADGNNGKGRYYQFQRMGLTNTNIVDFDHYYNIYNRIKDHSDFKQENIIENRYSDTMCQHLQNKTDKQKALYEQQANGFDPNILLNTNER